MILGILASSSYAGLSVVKGKLLLDGKPYRAMGINYFSGFCRVTRDPDDTSFREGLATLKKYEIPFIRFAACGFWPADWKLYQTDKERYFAILDDFVRTAESHGIGLIPCLFWHFQTIPVLVSATFWKCRNTGGLKMGSSSGGSSSPSGE